MLDFPHQYHASPSWRFPFKPKLSRGSNRITTKSTLQSFVSFPRKRDSLGDFLNSHAKSLASFADIISSSDSKTCVGRHKELPKQESLMATQGRLLCPQHQKAPQSRFNPKPYTSLYKAKCTKMGLHGKRVKVVCRYNPPANLNSQHQPLTGIKSRHKELHRCARRRIFRPALGFGRID